MTFLLAALMIAADVPLAACDIKDMPCILAQLAYHERLAKSLQNEVDLRTKHAELLTTENTLLKSDNDGLRAAIKPVIDAVKANERKVYESPFLWLGIGVAAGVLLTVLGAEAVHLVAAQK